MQNCGKLAGKTIFITGGSRGIGKAIALKAAKDKANIVICAKTADPHPKLEGTIFSAAEEIEAAGGKCLPVQVDVREEEQIKAAVDKAVSQFGGIDILINNASAIFLAGALETPMKRYDLMNGVNARGTFLTSKLCIPHLKKSKNPHIINMSPPLSLNPLWFKNNLTYTMAKYGMSMCVLGMAAEFKDDGIAVNALWPRTAIWTAAMEMMTGDDSANRCRKVDIVADAAYIMMLKNSREFTGKFCIDEELLKAEGITDLDQYAMEKGHELMPDFFLDDVNMAQAENELRKMSDGAFAQQKEHGKSGGGAKAQPSSGGGDVGAVFEKVVQTLKNSSDTKLRGVYGFNVDGQKWFLDVEKAKVSQDAPASGPICTLSMNNQDFTSLFEGKLSSTSAFMTGKLKIEGDMMAATKLDKLLVKHNKSK